MHNNTKKKKFWLRPWALNTLVCLIWVGKGHKTRVTLCPNCLSGSRWQRTALGDDQYLPPWQRWLFIRLAKCFSLWCNPTACVASTWACSVSPMRPGRQGTDAYVKPVLLAETWVKSIVWPRSCMSSVYTHETGAANLVVFSKLRSQTDAHPKHWPPLEDIGLLAYYFENW